MKVVVVYNPKSGSALPKSQLESVLKNVTVQVKEFIDITNDFEQHISKYVDQSTMPIVGYGGDGTLSSIAAQLIGKNALFAPLPGGTLNHFTKDLGIDQDLSAAVNKLSKATPRKVDVATVNGQLFLNNSSLGLYPSSLTERSRTESRLGKWPAAVVASVRAFVRFRIYDVTIAGKTYKTPFLFVGNNHYDIDAFLTRKSLSAGLLCAYMINSTKRSSLLKILLLTIIGRAQSASEFETFETDELTIKVNRRKIRVSYDGEHKKLSAPIVYKIHKKSLHVLF